MQTAKPLSTGGTGVSDEVLSIKNDKCRRSCTYHRRSCNQNGNQIRRNGLYLRLWYFRRLCRLGAEQSATAIGAKLPCMRRKNPTPGAAPGGFPVDGIIIHLHPTTSLLWDGQFPTIGWESAGRGVYPSWGAPNGFGVPHLAQNCAWGDNCAPQLTQKRFADSASRGEPQLMQKFISAETIIPHLLHLTEPTGTGGSSWGAFVPHF